MASTLASQLQLSAALLGSTGPTKARRGKPSLLFDVQKAADVDVQSIYEVARKGLEDLCKVDHRFAPFRDSLFGQASLSFNRDLQTADVLQKLDESVRAFLALLSSHFLLPAAFKTLEYLVRRYRINEHNVDPLLACALPYHGTNEFVRLVQTMVLDRTIWTWLAKMQESGAALPRQILVQRCMNDQAVLSFICDTAKAYGQRKAPNKTFLSFYAVTMCEVIASAQINESFLARLLPYVVDGLDASAATDYRAATLMLLAELCSRATLSQTFLKAVVNSVLQHVEPVPEHVRTVLLVLAHLASTQPQLHLLPEKSLKVLLALPNLHDELCSMSNRHIRIQPLVRLMAFTHTALLLSPGSPSNSPSSSQQQAQLGLEQLAAAGLLEPCAQELTEQLLRGAAKARVHKDAAGRPAVQRVLRYLENRYFKQVDAAINAVLGRAASAKQPPAAAAAQHGADDSDADESDHETAETVEAKAVFALLQSLSGTAHVQCGDTSLTLAAAVDAPQANVRRMALKQIDAALADPNTSPAARDHLYTCIINRLEDEELEVVGAALSLACLCKLPLHMLLPALAAQRQRLAAQLFGQARFPGLKAARVAVKKLLGVLVTLASNNVPGASDEATLMVLDLVLPTKRAYKLCCAAITAAGQLKHPLAAALHAADLETLAVKVDVNEGPEPTAGKEGHHPSSAAAAEAQTPGKAKKGKGKGKKAAEDTSTAAAAAETAGSQEQGKQGHWANKAEQNRHRDEAAAALQRSVVEALARAFVQQPALIEEVSRLAAVARQGPSSSPAASTTTTTNFLRARHLLLLALQSAVAALKKGGQQATTAGRRTAVAKASTAAPTAAATAAAATALAQLAQAEIASLATAGSSEVSDQAAAGFYSWQAAAAELLDEEGLPTAAHLASLVSEVVKVHATVLCKALLTALQVCTTQQAATGGIAAAPGLPQGVDGAAAAFCALAALQPMEAFHDHLCMLAAQAAASRQAAGAAAVCASAPFLAALYADPEMPTAARVAALQLQAAVCCNSAAAAQAAYAKQHSLQQVQAWAPYLLAALTDPVAEVRLSAVKCLAAVASADAPDAAPALLAMLKALAAQQPLLNADLIAATIILRNTFAAGPGDARTPAAGQKRRAGAAAAKQQQQQGADAGASGVSLNLDAATVGEAFTLLAAAVADVENSRAGTAAALATLAACVQPPKHQAGTAAQRAVLQAPAFRLLQQLLAPAQAPVASSVPAALAPTQQQLGALLIPSVYCSELVGQLPSEAMAVLNRLLSLTGNASMRMAALQVLENSESREALFSKAPELQNSIFQAVLWSSAGDPDPACRAAARNVLEGMPVDAALLLPILQAVHLSPAQEAPASQDKPKRKKSKIGQQANATGQDVDMADTAGQAPAPTGPASADLELAVLALELLQWKRDVQDVGTLVEAVQGLVQELQPALTSIATAHQEAGPEDEEPAGQAARSGQSSITGYAAQLAFSVLEMFARHHTAVAAPTLGPSPSKARATAAAPRGILSKFRLDLVVAVVQNAPDNATRNTALSLLAVLASLLPEAVLVHVLQVLSLLNQSAALESDEYSQQVAATTLAAVVPAWLGAGKQAQDLWVVVVQALPEVPAHRRLPLLSALMQHMDQGMALPIALLLLLQKAVELAPSPASKSSVKPKHAAAQASQQSSQPLPEPSREPSPSDWLPDLAAQLAMQVEPATRLASFSSLLEQAVASCNNLAHQPLPRLAVTFVTTQLKAKSLTTPQHAAASADAAAVPADPLQASCEALMSQALAQMQMLAAAQEANAAADSPSRKLQRAVRHALDGLYALLKALQSVMVSALYLRALLKLAVQPSDKVRRRTLKLFADKVRSLKQELEDLTELPAKQRQQHEQQLAASALSICSLLGQQQQGQAAAAAPHPDILAGSSAMSQQQLLLALSATAEVLGKQHPEPLLGCMPQLLLLAASSSAAVRGSTLVTVAAVVRAIGTRVVPLLPQTVCATLDAANAACQRLDAESCGGSAGGSNAERAAPQQRDGGNADDEDAEDGAAGKEEEVAVELASSLAALDALVEVVGAYLSPYLPDILGLLLKPAVLSCQSAGVAHFSASIRQRLPVVLPARLLLEPLFGALQPAVEAGHASTVSLLSLVSATATGLEPAVAAAHHESMFLFLLRTLDVRHVRPASLAGHIHEVESAAVKVLVALVMKLSESKFRPMFLRLLEWVGAAEPGSGSSGYGSGLGRLVALFSAVGALTERLRSVFVPYFRYLLDLSVKHLTAGGAAERPKKKRKQQKEQEAAAGQSAEELEDTWVLRAKVVRALHRCFLYDSVGFLDADKFNRLLPPLVQQLELEPPEAVAAAVAEQATDADLDTSVTLSHHMAFDTMGVAAVACLAQMARTANSDVLWKPLNHRVLMCTRSPLVRTRCLGLEVVAQLADKLREEYLVLLPETIPFLAELLEDSEHAVEARAQEVVRALEDISGEKLDEYLKT